MGNCGSERGQYHPTTRGAKNFLADWACLCVLTELGGVWLDATCLCQKPVTAWMDCDLNEVQGFSAPFADDCLESWAFACPPRHPSMIAWKDEFEKALLMTFEEYKKQLPTWATRHTLYEYLPYLTIHAAYLMSSRRLNRYAVMQKSCTGPFKYLCDNDWMCQNLLRLLFTAIFSEDYLKPTDK